MSNMNKSQLSRPVTPDISHEAAKKMGLLPERSPRHSIAKKPHNKENESPKKAREILQSLDSKVTAQNQKIDDNVQRLK
ncbi:hypothetical protein KQX54_010820 [Cotesia glomerata]|uniref:Uncharacterized protein n=1 Tax=Cotesia glomerata TaxID=32391 RepID=A0AAV7ILA1_COTGL|nr:hypothetical protein KQX54_010820 [Cotesia glomerata]